MKQPRTYLFVPANRPDRFAKATVSGADAIILDLEDAVAPEAKVEARASAKKWLCAGGRAYVRINAANTEWHAADAALLADCEGVDGLVIPKTESAGELAAIASLLPCSKVLLPLVETARAFEHLREIARVPKVQRLVFGTLDFQIDMGIRGDGTELLYFRSQLTLVSRLTGLTAPVDGITADIEDGQLLRDETLRARNLGFRAKLCVHPKQVRHVHAAFLPTAEETDWAKRVLAANRKSKGSATTVDGKMIDVPIIRKAQEILSAANIAAID